MSNTCKKKKKEILITHISNVNVTNNYVYDDDNALNSISPIPRTIPSTQCKELSTYIVNTVQF